MPDRPWNFDIAIVGMSGRFPGAGSVSRYWQNLCEGVESVSFFSDAELLDAGVDPARVADPNYVKAAPTLPDIETFDAAFFGYSPKDAALMDPQQRLFLEVCWEALEDAGYDPAGYPGRVGVLSTGGGVVTSYLLAKLGAADLPGQTASIQHINNDKDFLSTRVSFKLNLTGPSFTVQSACSSSLLAVYYACQNLRFGECDAMLVGGSVVRVPQVEGYLAEKRNLHSLDGHCRPFDAEGQGTIFGSGVGAVLLKPLDRALADRDHVHAVIKGMAINNDGANKSSYTAPSLDPQAQAVRDALEAAGVSAETMGYLECHSTGTIVGDPLEIEALSRAFRSQTERRQFCAVGSVKANIGHPEQAAGIAGLIKTALVLSHRQIPPSINFDTPNPEIPFETSPFFVNDRLSAFERTDTPRRAGLNSLGIGGTNVFAVLEEAPPVAPAAALAPEIDAAAPHVVTLSAKSGPALAEQVAAFARWLDANPDAPLADLCFTTNVSRSQFRYRFAAPVRSISDLRARLAAWLAGPGRDGTALTRTEEGRAAFLFSGQGTQHAGMAAALHRAYPAFREALDRCAALADPHLKRDLLGVILGEDGDEGLIDRTEYTQPALFAVEHALVALLDTWGIRPDAVMGHSLGEFTAACVGGALSLEDAVRLVCVRGAITEGLAAGGAMLAVIADETATREVVDTVAPALSFAAMNGPLSTVVSGDIGCLERLKTALDGRGITWRDLRIANGFHSPIVDPVLDAFEAEAARIAASPPRIALVSNVTGARLIEAPGAAYWRRHLREGVRFADGMQALAALDCMTYIEVGPHPVLLPMGQACLGAGAGRAIWAATLNRQETDGWAMSEMLATLYRAGHDIDWHAVNAPFARRRIPLPTYPFQRKRHWIDTPPVVRPRGGAVAKDGVPPGPMDRRQHPLLGKSMSAGSGQMRFRAQLGVGRQSYLADHGVSGTVVLPTTAELEVVTAAGRRFFGTTQIALEDIRHHGALSFPDAQEVAVEVRLRMLGSDAASVEIASAPPGGEVEPSAWRLLLTATLRRAPRAAFPEISIRRLIGACDGRLGPEDVYSRLSARGLDYGPSFRGICEAHLGDGEVVARIELPDCADPSDYILHPAFLDACLHAYPLMIGDRGSGTGPARACHLPISLERFAIFRDGIDGAWAHSRVRRIDPDGTGIVDIDIYDNEARRAAEIRGLAVRELAFADVLPERDGEIAEGPLYTLAWRDAGRPAAVAAAVEAPATWIVLADATRGIGRALAGRLGARGHLVHAVAQGDRLERLGDAAWTADPNRPEDLRSLMAEIDAGAGPRAGGIVHLWGLDAPGAAALTLPTLEASCETLARSALGLVHALAERRGADAGARRLWFVTEGATGAGGDAAAVSPVQASLWGLGRTVALEHPGVWGGLIDLGGMLDPGEAAERMAVELTAPDGELQIVLDRSGRRVARMVPSLLNDLPERTCRIDADACYLVTGGLGMIGRSIAGWLIAKGARHLVLTGRAAGEADLAAIFEPAEIARAEIRAISADISDAADVARIMDGIARDMPPLRGVVHSAGVLDDGILAQLDWPRFRELYAPRVFGGWLLHEATRTLDLDFFLLQSSLLSLTGSAGQGNYTAASAFLDALAACRRAEGLPATAINWCAWSEGGLATRSGSRGEAMWSALGMEFMSPARAMELFDAIMDRDVSQIAVAVADWQRFSGKLGDPPMLRELVDGAGTGARAPIPESPAAPGAGRGTAPPRSAAVAGDARRGALLSAVTACIMEELGFTEPIDPAVPLNEIGLDSLLSVRLSNSLEERFGVAIPVAILIGGPSIGNLLETFFRDHADVALPDPEACSRETDADAAPKARRIVPAAPCEVPPASAGAGQSGNLAETLNSVVMVELGFDEPVDPEQPLGEIGLDSLLSVRLSNRLEEEFGLIVPVSDLIAGPSVNDLAARLAGQWPPARGLRDRAPSSIPAVATVGVAPPREGEAAAWRSDQIGRPLRSAVGTLPEAAVRPHVPIGRAGAREVVAPPAMCAGAASGKWLIAPRPNPEARARLFCFPYAGGGLTSFRNWPDVLPPDIEVVAVEPPGRGTRLREAPVRDMDQFVSALLPELLEWLDRPAAMFGHCLGGLTMFATLLDLRKTASIRHVRHAFACGIRAPHLLRERSRFEDALMYELMLRADYDTMRLPFAQPDDVFAELIRQFNTPAAEEMLAIPQLRKLLLPTVRVEFEMAHKYRHPPVRPFEFPISSFVGDRDPWVAAAQAKAWGDYTSAGFVCHERPGTHFLMGEDQAFIGARIAAALTLAPA